MSSASESRGLRLGLEELHLAAQEMRAIAVTDIFAAENIADRVLGMYLKERSLESLMKEQSTMTDFVECASCGLTLPFSQYLDENPMATDDICAECIEASKDGCAKCRMKWMRANPNFVFHWAECRKIALPC